jgi:hypothetical protein
MDGQRRIDVLPHREWQKVAEVGYLYALGLKPVPSWKDGVGAERHVQRAICYAILAMLDAQPGRKEDRVFRGWFFDLSKQFDANLSGNGHGRVGQPHNRLHRDTCRDTLFLVRATTTEGEGARCAFALQCFHELYSFIQDVGHDTRPLWLRGVRGWPMNEGGSDDR